ncbi:hypothetical protein JCGZ_11278 [Jatropha curcas]|uniref:Uncharacterized protein n=1 Tax=Jatropha curcas TaxID=180498 RepID=A0A067KF84_JATCU|nr:hypothetical protein JCGZ_11278 [Jatropha curcas]
MTEICSTTQDLILLALAWLELKRIVVGEVARGNGRAQPVDPWLVSLEEQRNDESTVPNAANRDLSSSFYCDNRKQKRECEKGRDRSFIADRWYLSS